MAILKVKVKPNSKQQSIEEETDGSLKIYKTKDKLIILFTRVGQMVYPMSNMQYATNVTYGL